MKLQANFITALKQLANEREIPEEKILEIVEKAIAGAYRKEFGSKEQNIKAKVNEKTGEVKIFDVKKIVEVEKRKNEDGTEVLMVVSEDQERKFNPKTDIKYEDAIKVDPQAKIGEEIKVELPLEGDLGRVAAQTAKQIMIQNLRELEKELIYEEYKSKEGEMVYGIIQKIVGKNVYVELDKVIALLPPNQQIKDEKYSTHQRIRAVILEVKKTSKGPEVILSRTSPKLVEKLFISEVPEIANGVVEIKGIVREPGVRTKIAVASNEPNIDPIGACVGQRGVRVQTIINELGGEKIDIIEYKDNLSDFIASALAPAKVLRVEVDEKERKAKVYVKKDQQSLAIGKDGQNVRLAAKLTKCDIEIIIEGEEEKEEDKAEEKENKK